MSIIISRANIEQFSLKQYVTEKQQSLTLERLEPAELGIVLDNLHHSEKEHQFAAVGYGVALRCCAPWY